MNGSNRIRLIRARSKSDTEQSESVAAKAVGYVRVSTEEQAVNGHGLQVQERADRSPSAADRIDSAARGAVVMVGGRSPVPTRTRVAAHGPKSTF